MLQELEVHDATVLIHYALPIMKPVFNLRMACILRACEAYSQNTKVQLFCV